MLDKDFSGWKIVPRDKSEVVKEEDWIWLPRGVHFIGWSACRFRMTTVVGDFIVSTIGEYCPYVCNTEISDMALNYDGEGVRRYETKVFLAKEKEDDENEWYIDDFSFETLSDYIIETRFHLTSSNATYWHMELCKQYSFKKVVAKENLNDKEKCNCFKCSIMDGSGCFKDFERSDDTVGVKKEESDKELDNYLVLMVKDNIGPILPALIVIQAESIEDAKKIAIDKIGKTGKNYKIKSIETNSFCIYITLEN